MESKFRICVTFHMAKIHGHELYSIWGMNRFFWSCKKQPLTSRREPLSSNAHGHVFSSNVLTDERAYYMHVSSLVSNGLSKGGI